ncbi:hypothetical protein DNTS_015772 [Danionella cerebrum]|uniref:Uncharacterized protein n=1 Tax=Danionella cerebrum TaxID=2873325 RepID=A0A553R0R9_9TELE|nr:hypothetical protein DNTS_015772 [Danionella translucida]
MLAVDSRRDRDSVWTAVDSGRIVINCWRRLPNMEAQTGGVKSGWNQANLLTAVDVVRGQDSWVLGDL